MKTKLREQFRGQIPVWPAGWDIPLLDWLRRQPSGLWGAFVPLPDEAPILASLDQVQNLSWAFPSVQGESLEFRRIAGGSRVDQTIWRKGRFGLEPGPEFLPVVPSELKGLLIPAVAFDRRGYRLGRGGGYYDRFLEMYAGQRVGVVHSTRILLEVPAEAHDQRVDWLATESAMIAIR